MKTDSTFVTSNQSVIACLGSSRGLGAAVAHMYERYPHKILRIARKFPLLETKLQNFTSSQSTVIDIQADFSQEDQWPQIVETLIAHQVQRIFYFAGGGPYGHFPESKWSAQVWSHRVSFLFPAFLIHAGLKHFQQIIVAGSSIAGNSADPGAAMYAAAKHGLRGLIGSVQLENKSQQQSFDLRLFSPGYMDTGLLPKNAWPRVRPPEGMRIFQPQDVAQLFYEFAENQALCNQNIKLPAFENL